MWAQWLGLVVGSVPLAVQGLAGSSNMPTIDYIPNDISSNCSTLLTQLDEDNLFQQCTEPLINATNAFAVESTTVNSSDALQSSLRKLCDSGTGCDRSLVRHFLGQFWDQCSDELEKPNDQVLKLYNYLYIFNPFHDAVCSKDHTGQYCLSSIVRTMAQQEDSQLSRMYRRSVPDDIVADVYSDEYWERVLESIPRSRNVSFAKTPSNSSTNTTQLPQVEPQQAFFFLSGSSDKSSLCTECSQNVLAAYIAFELTSPYALGLENSDVLKSQHEIYDHARSLCGTEFLQTVNQKAGVQGFSGPASSATVSSVRRPLDPSWLCALIVLGTIALWYAM